MFRKVTLLEISKSSFNYKPVSILPTLSKCFGKCMFSQMSAYFDEIFSKWFQKGVQFSTMSFSLTRKMESCSRQSYSIWGFVNWFVEGIWWYQSWTSFCETKCVWVYFTCFKISPWLFVRQKAEDKGRI